MPCCYCAKVGSNMAKMLRCLQTLDYIVAISELSNGLGGFEDPQDISQWYCRNQSVHQMQLD